MKIDRELIKKRIKRGRIYLSFTPYQLKQLDAKRHEESRASYVKRIFLTHERSSNTFKDE